MKPMLAVNAGHLSTVKLPVLASPKLDGVRCLTKNGLAMTRNGKPLGNNFIRGILQGTPQAHNLDGELVTLDLTGKIKAFNECSGDIRRSSGAPDFEFLIFDSIHENALAWSFNERLEYAKDQTKGSTFLKVVPHIWCKTVGEVEQFEEYCVGEGYEGIMLRDPYGPYKHGRSTQREGYLLKVKRFEDDEAEVVGYDPLVLKDGTVDESRAGALLLLSPKFGRMRVGSGFTDEQRRHIVSHRHAWVGEQVTFKYQPSGMNEDGKPRFPVFKGIRDTRDM